MRHPSLSHSIVYGALTLLISGWTSTFSAAASALPPTPADLEMVSKAADEIVRLINGKEWWAAERRTEALLAKMEGTFAESHPDVCQLKIWLARNIYFEQGRWTAARDLLWLTVRDLKKNKPAELDPTLLPSTLVSLAKVEYKLHDSAAIEHVNEAIKSLEGAKNTDDTLTELTVRATRLRGEIRAQEGDRNRAREDFQNALALATRLARPDPLLVATLNHFLALFSLADAEHHRLSNRTDEAKAGLVAAQKHLQAVEKYCGLVKIPVPASNRLCENAALTREALTAAMQARPPVDGGDAFSTSSTAILSLDERRPEDREALIHNNRAMTLVAAGEHSKADGELEAAVRILEKAGSSNRRVLFLLRLNQMHLRGVYLNAADQAVEQGAAVLDMLYDLTVEDLASQSRSEQEVTIARLEPVLIGFVSVAMRANRPPAEIYEHVFRWKGLHFAVNSGRGLSAGTLAQYRRLVESTDEAQRVHDICLSSPFAAAADRQRAKDGLDRARQDRTAFLAVNNPKTEVNPAALAAALEPGTVFVDYVAFVDLNLLPAERQASPVRYMAFVLNAGRPGVSMVRLPAPLPETNGQIIRWRELLTIPSKGMELRAAGVRIREGIWDAVEPLCRDARLVWVCPYSALWGFPFAALPTGTDDYLVRRFAVGYAVSGRQALLSRTTPRRKPGGLVTVSGIAYADGLKPIPGSQELAADVARQHEGDPVLALSGGEATKDAFRKAVRQEGTDVCFVGHGVWSRPANAEVGVLVSAIDSAGGAQANNSGADAGFRLPLAGARSSGPGVPSPGEHYLSDDELADSVPPNANRFELWACSGSLGRVIPTEGLLGFPRTLLQAGYRTVLAAQWDVPLDTSLLGIAADFHRGIYEDGVGPAAAVQRAQLYAIARGEVNARPREWAAWVVTGDPGPAPLPVTFSQVEDAPRPTTRSLLLQWTIVLAGIMLGMGVIVWWRRRRPSLNHRAEA